MSGGVALSGQTREAAIKSLSDRGMTSELNENRDTILQVAASHGATNVRVFDSAARDALTDDSDIDLLVTMEAGKSLLDLIGLAHDLEDLLGRHVDVVSDRGLSPYLRDAILAEAVAL